MGQETKETKEIKVLFCDCGWKSDPDVGMKNECPDCKGLLRFVCGTKSEIEEYFINYRWDKKLRKPKK